ncbi:hypothetical protein [Streptomyces sp. NPDC093094]|uniref:hypothetical protein n=1 Tax=Streptomyces sp. NPDC093094 TaxID=3366026 RepID=UPI003816EDD7
MASAPSTSTAGTRTTSGSLTASGPRTTDCLNDWWWGDVSRAPYLSGDCSYGNLGDHSGSYVRIGL